uniref:Uncharacterized protein n=1 Tax=Siphoviridae sp. ctquf9 TaxID=2826470 RepID=A0A8S5M4S0_9CAUD|nr:MAG TPA: hypothetical protein [Siphoviridae sp. ctquf9]
MMQISQYVRNAKNDFPTRYLGIPFHEKAGGRVHLFSFV